MRENVQPQYTSIALPVQNQEGEFPDFSYVAVKNGVSIGNIFKVNNTPDGMPVVCFPDYETFVSILSTNPDIIEHMPVPHGTEWDGEKFLLVEEEDDGFEVIGEITAE